VNTRWVAARHVEQLGESAVAVFDDDAVRDGLARALADISITGIALCGHGDGGKQVFLLDRGCGAVARGLRTDC
jgi:hypothetical protein